MVPVSATMSNSFRAPASILKNARKRPFLYGRGHNFARDSCFDMNDILYARPISSLSNGVYLMQWRRKRGGRGAVAPQNSEEGRLAFWKRHEGLDNSVAFLEVTWHGRPCWTVKGAAADLNGAVSS